MTRAMMRLGTSASRSPAGPATRSVEVMPWARPRDARSESAGTADAALVPDGFLLEPVVVAGCRSGRCHRWPPVGAQPVVG